MYVWFEFCVHMYQLFDVGYASSDVDDINFSENEEDLGKIITRIDAEINGLFKTD